MDQASGALARVLRRAGGPAVLDALAKDLPGADLTTLLLAVARARAAALTPPDVLRRYRSDRFVAPAQVPFRALRRAEDALLAALPAAYEPITPAPLAPMGAHSAVAANDQNRVVTTMRGTEVAADPTNLLALEAADRRRTAPGSTEPVRLAASQRVVRAQQFAGAGRFAHFTLFAMVAAGRSAAGFAFERTHAVEQVGYLVDAMRAAGAVGCEVRLTLLDEHYAPVGEAIRAALATRPWVTVTDYPERADGHGYYTGLCFKVYTDMGADPFEVGDGGFTDWTARLLGNRRERLLTAGIGVDRLALALR